MYVMAGVTHAISPISFKLSQFMRVNKLFKNPERFGIAVLRSRGAIYLRDLMWGL